MNKFLLRRLVKLGCKLAGISSSPSNVTCGSPLKRVFICSNKLSTRRRNIVRRKYIVGDLCPGIGVVSECLPITSSRDAYLDFCPLSHLLGLFIHRLTCKCCLSILAHTFQLFLHNISTCLYASILEHPVPNPVTNG